MTELKRRDGTLIVEDENKTIRQLCEENGAYLNGAYLNGADLNGAYLTGAHLNGAYLNGAYLNGADLTGADLTGAHLNGAHLNWNSHVLLAEILLRATGADVEKCKVAGLVSIGNRLSLCWDDFLAMDSESIDWALGVLAAHDNLKGAPQCVLHAAERAKARKGEEAECK